MVTFEIKTNFCCKTLVTEHFVLLNAVAAAENAARLRTNDDDDDDDEDDESEVSVN